MDGRRRLSVSAVVEETEVLRQLSVRRRRGLVRLSRRVGAVWLSVVLAVTLLGEAAAFARPATDQWQPPAPPEVSGVAVKPIRPGPAPDLAVGDLRVTQPPQVTWPQPGSWSVSMPADSAAQAGLVSADGAPRPGLGGRAPVGDLPIRVGAAPLTAEQSDDVTRGVARAQAAAPQTVRVRVADRSTASAVGVQGLLMAVGRGDGRSADARLTVEVDYSSFARAYGGDWAARLRLVALPDCDLDAAAGATQPGACGKPTALPTGHDHRAGVLTATVPLSGDGGFTTVAVSAAPAGANGDYTATGLSPAGTWQVSTQTGGFSWSHPLRMVPGVNGPVPNLSLSYSSQAVDGRTGNTNTQGSWIGDGWEMWPGYVERRYQSCMSDTDPVGGQQPNNPYPTGDLCWFSDNATLSLNGRATELVKAADGTWKGVSDDGSRIERLTDTGLGNGDADGEHWKVTTTDGTQYFFGRHRRPSYPDDTAATGSTWTVPVYGNHPGEPCHATGFSESRCTQAWRWNLDYVVDVHGNSMTYFYAPESGAYAREADPDLRTTYHRGGYLTRIEYGTRFGAEHVGAVPARVVFDVADRCLPGAVCDTAHPESWPDTPWDQWCAAAPCTGQGSPTFWTQKRLAKIRTQVWRGSAHADVESWTLRHDYLDAGASDGEGVPMWLTGITHTGHVSTAGGAQVSDPEVIFDPGSTPLPNRVDGPNDGKTWLNRFRLKTVWTEAGAVIGVTYSGQECTRSTLPQPHTNGKRCYPQWYGPNGLDPTLDWFHKYVVNAVVVDDTTGASTRMETYYDYLDTPAWHHDDSELVEPDKRTWSQWRGYSNVRVRQGSASGTQAATEYRYLRGMHGDRATPSGGTKSVQVTDSQGVSIDDHEAHAGFVRESITYNGVGGALVSGSINEPWRHGPTAASGPLKAWLTNTATTRTRTAVEGGGTRWTRSTTSFDTTYGLPTTVDDLGDESSGADDKCTRYQYARNTTIGLVDKVSSTETVAVNCATTPQYPKDLLSAERTFFDDPDNFGTEPTRGLPVRTEQVDSWNTGPVWVTTSRSSYDIHGRLTEVSDELDRRTVHGYTPSAGGPVVANSLTNALGHVATTEVEPAWGKATRTVDANGHTAELTYDGLGRVSKVWLPGRDRATQAPNLQFDYQVRNNAASAVTTRTLLPIDNTYRISISLFDGSLRPRQTQTQAPGGGRTISDTIYDSRGLVAWTSKEFYDTSGAAPSTTLVGAGQPQIPGIVEQLYDGAGRLTAEIVKALGVEKWRTSIAYGGDRVHLTPPQGGTASTSISDARGKTTALRQYHAATPSGSYDETTYTHTPLGQLASVTDAAGNTWSWTYDLRGRKVSAADPDAGTSTYTYDSAGQLLTSTDARGVSLGYTYDDLGRKTSVRDGSPTGALRAGWVYDTLLNGKGQLTRSIRYDGADQYITEVLGYDNAGRPSGHRTVIPATETGLAGTYDTAVTYLPDGSPYTMVMPGVGGLPQETLVHAYNDVGALTEVVSQESIYVYSVAYNKLGELTQRVLGNFGKRTSITYTIDEPTGRLVNTSAVPENKPEILDLAYSHDPAGNLLRIADSPGSSLPTETQCFRYDQQQRLVKAWTPASKTSTNCVADPAVLGGPAKYWHDYTYDVTGNRRTQVDHTSAGLVTTTYTHPDAGTPRPHTVSTATSSGPTGTTLQTFAYDPAGNTIERVVGGDTQTLDWDTEGRVASITDPAGATSYLYDADGNRLIRRDPDGKTLYLAGQELHVDDASGARSGTRYYSHLNTAIAVRTPQGVTWTVTDHHNTGEAMIRESDMAVQRRRTLPFGDTRGTEPTWWAGDKGFVGGTKDPTGLTHLGARLYDPTLGRFISIDPIMDLTDPQQMHGYAYANNNPTTMSDPDGLCVRLDDPNAPCIGSENWLELQTAFDAKQQANQSSGGGGGGGSGGGTVDPGPAPTEDPALAAANAAAEQAKQQLINAAKTLAQIAMDELGITAALDCFTNGDLGSCAETALNVAGSFVGGLASKLARKYGPPSMWRKGAAVAKRLYGALADLTSGVKNWWNNSRLAQRLARSGCNSFVPGTAVLMADGSTKPIEEVDVGDTVLATDPETGQTQEKTVVATIIGNGSKNLVEITVDTDGADGNASGVIVATDGHPFWVADLNEWVDATELRAGQWLRTSAGTWVQVTAVQRWVQTSAVHNLTITDVHTYYVLAAGTPLLVHNAACDIENNRHRPGCNCDPFREGTVLQPLEAQNTRYGAIEELGGVADQGLDVAHSSIPGTVARAPEAPTISVPGNNAGAPSGTAGVIALVVVAKQGAKAIRDWWRRR